jgi:hypothetical protein
MKGKSKVDKIVFDDGDVMYTHYSDDGKRVKSLVESTSGEILETIYFYHNQKVVGIIEIQNNIFYKFIAYQNPTNIYTLIAFDKNGESIEICSSPESLY